MNIGGKRILPSTIILIVLSMTGIALGGFLISGDGFMRKGSLWGIGKQQAISNVWLSPMREKIKAGETFDIKVFVNTQKNVLSAFDLSFKFNINDLTVNVNQGEEGISKGVDSGNFILMVNPNDTSYGHFRFSGICAQGCVNGSEKHIATIHAKAEKDFNFSDVTSQLEVKELADELGKAMAFEQK